MKKARLIKQWMEYGQFISKAFILSIKTWQSHGWRKTERTNERRDHQTKTKPQHKLTNQRAGFCADVSAREFQPRFQSFLALSAELSENKRLPFIRGPFLESPETFRAHFGWHNSLCIFKTKASRETKLCSYLNIYEQTNFTD